MYTVCVRVCSLQMYHSVSLILSLLLIISQTFHISSTADE